MDEQQPRRRGRIAQAAIDKMTAEVQAAEALGHVVEFARARQGTVARCSCKWESTPRRRMSMVAGSGMWHVLEVNEVARTGGDPSTWEWTPAPSTLALLASLRDRGVSA